MEADCGKTVKVTVVLGLVWSKVMSKYLVQLEVPASLLYLSGVEADPLLLVVDGYGLLIGYVEKLVRSEKYHDSSEINFILF